MMTDDLVVDVSHDWLLACDVQQRFMGGPKGPSIYLDYSAQCRQVRALGGDCYDLIPLGDDRLALAVGDASGKGLAAALMIANVQSSLRTAALFTDDDVSVLAQVVNQQTYLSSAEDRFATFFYGVFDGVDHTLRYVNAGHTPAVVIRSDGSHQWLESTGAPLGLFPDSSYEESVVQLERGELVIAYTDGVIECENENGQWGVEGLLKAAFSGAQCADAEDMVGSIFDCMDRFSNRQQCDDATLLVARVL